MLTRGWTAGAESFRRWSKGPGDIRGQGRGLEPHKASLTVCSGSRGRPRRKAAQQDATSSGSRGRWTQASRVGTRPVMSKWQEWTGDCARLLPPGTRVRPASQHGLPRASLEASREGSREDSGEKAASALGRASFPGRKNGKQLRPTGRSALERARPLALIQVHSAPLSRVVLSINPSTLSLLFNKLELRPSSWVFVRMEGGYVYICLA